MLLYYIIKFLELFYTLTVTILLFTTGIPLIERYPTDRVEYWFMITCLILACYQCLYNNLLINMRFK